MQNLTRYGMYFVVPFAIGASVVVSSPALMPVDAMVPHFFSANTPALAVEVNDNFKSLADAIDINGDLIDAMGRPANTLIVSPTNGDFDSVADAMDSITDSSASNPYLVRVFPGIYDETSTVVVPKFVELVGAGTSATVIRRDARLDDVRCCECRRQRVG